MTFDKLADRCLLFIDERKQMIIELLKEAELEMTRKVNIYEDTRNYVCSGESSYGLPSNFKQTILLQHDGEKLFPTSESEVAFNTDNDVDSGIPTTFYLRNNSIFLDTKPGSGKMMLSYYGTVDGLQDLSSDPSPIIPSLYHRDLCDYAIAIASAKLDPNLHTKHWQVWLSSLEAIKNEDADRELIHSIRREI